MKNAVNSIILEEQKRQENTLNLIASENFASSQVLATLGSVLTNKYSEGYPEFRYYGGNQYIDQIEDLCQQKALKLYDLSVRKWHVNVQPYSGSIANLAVYVALVPLGEKIMGLALDMGGHLTHGHRASFTGKAWKATPYFLDKKTELLDYEAIAKLAKKEKPKLIIAGYTAYSRIIDFKKFRQIADSIGAYLMVDMSHFAGLVSGNVYPSPFPHADVITTTTHKTLRGPRAAMIFVNRNSKTASKENIDIVKAIDKAVFPGLQGGPHINQIAATAIALQEANSKSFQKYAHQIVKNARALAVALDKLGFRIVSKGTDSHLFLVDLTNLNMNGKTASDLLETNNIVVNKNAIPFDTASPIKPSGIRLGTPALTTRGMKEKEMHQIAHLIADAIIQGKNVKSRVLSLCKLFPLKF